MSRSIFDPAGGMTERSGSMFTPPDAGQVSHLPEEFLNPQSNDAGGTVGFEAPAERPAVVVDVENGGKLLILRMTGKLQKEDYQSVVLTVDAAVALYGKVRMLVEMHNFHGWSPVALWEDRKLDLRHFNHVERVAIVGEAAWEKGMAILSKPFTTAAVKYFPREQQPEARAWIRAE